MLHTNLINMITSFAPSATDDECEIETGTLLEADLEPSVFQTILAVVAGGAIGIMTYKALHRK